MQASETKPKHSLMGDNPVLSRDDDWLNFDGFVQPLAERMIASLSNTPFTVGILADWGQGKSSVMRMLQLKLEVKHCPTIWFEPWKYNSREEVWKGLAHTLVTQIEKNDDVRREIRRKLPSLKKWLVKTIFGRFFGDDGRNLIDAIDSEPWSPSMLHEFEGFLEKLFGILYPRSSTDTDGFKVPTVLFVDDLDRCLPGTALAVLEAMKLVLNRPGMIIVMGVAERELCRAVTAAYAKEMGDLKDGVNLEWGYKYVRKIFQIPIHVPTLTPQSLDNYVNKCMEGSGVSSSLGTRPEWHGIIHGACEANLREIKRLINIFVTEMDKADANAAIIDPVLDSPRVFFVQLLARRFPDFYTHILRYTGLERDMMIRFQNLFLADGSVPSVHTLGQEGSRFLENADLRAFFRSCMSAGSAVPLVDSFSDPLALSAFLQFGLRAKKEIRTETTPGGTLEGIFVPDGITAAREAFSEFNGINPLVGKQQPTETVGTSRSDFSDLPSEIGVTQHENSSGISIGNAGPVSLDTKSQEWYDRYIHSIQDCLASGDFANALRQSRSAIDWFNNSHHPELATLFLGKTAEILQLAGKHDEAVEAFRQQLNLLNDSGAILTVNRFMTRSLRISGKLQEALQVAETATQQAVELKDTYGLLDSLGETARCLLALDRLSEARSIFLRTILESAPHDKRKYMEAKLGLAQVEFREKSFAAAKIILVDVYEEAQRAYDKELQANALQQIAAVSENMSDPWTAIDSLLAERELRKQLGDRALEAECLWNNLRMSVKMNLPEDSWGKPLADLVSLAERTDRVSVFSKRAQLLGEEAKLVGDLEKAARFQRIWDRLRRN
jgi:tetratricopeptide (TPR) repeat protein